MELKADFQKKKKISPRTNQIDNKTINKVNIIIKYNLFIIMNI